jgi:hypothetical protein
MKLPKEIREQFRRYGREGGRARAARVGASERRRIARRGATTRWIRSRFGVSRFADLSLPGAELVDRGLADLAAERTTQGSLLVSLAEPRLRREGIPIGRVERDPERRLYELLAQTEGDLAHARYTALLRQIASFADACCLFRFAAKHA